MDSNVQPATGRPADGGLAGAAARPGRRPGQPGTVHTLLDKLPLLAVTAIKKLLRRGEEKAFRDPDLRLAVDAGWHFIRWTGRHMQP